jgi:hypothetical protein
MVVLSREFYSLGSSNVALVSYDSMDGSLLFPGEKLNVGCKY